MCVCGNQMIKVDSITMMKSPGASEKHDISHHRVLTATKIKWEVTLHLNQCVASKATNC